MINKTTPHLFTEVSKDTPDAFEIGIQTKFNKIHSLVIVTNDFWRLVKAGDKECYATLMKHLRSGWETTRLCYPALMEVEPYDD